MYSLIPNTHADPRRRSARDGDEGGLTKLGVVPIVPLKWRVDSLLEKNEEGSSDEFLHDL
jgi:hypothetical protein